MSHDFKMQLQTAARTLKTLGHCRDRDTDTTRTAWQRQKTEIKQKTKSKQRDKKKIKNVQKANNFLLQKINTKR